LTLTLLVTHYHLYRKSPLIYYLFQRRLWQCVQTHFSFFKFIFHYYGSHAVRLLKLWIGYRKKIIKNCLHIRFLKQCINNNTTPQHLNIISNWQINNWQIKLLNHRSNCKFSHCKRSMIKKILCIELNDAFTEGLFFMWWAVFLAVSLRESLMGFSIRKKNRAIFFSKKRRKG